MWKKLFGKAGGNAAASQAAGPVEYIVAGLGNPGSKYEGTRHNAGFMALDAIAEKANAPVDRLKFKGLTGRATVGGKSVLLLKPSTFMNLSCGRPWLFIMFRRKRPFFFLTISLFCLEKSVSVPRGAPADITV